MEFENPEKRDGSSSRPTQHESPIAPFSFFTCGKRTLGASLPRPVEVNPPPRFRSVFLGFSPGRRDGKTQQLRSSLGPKTESVRREWTGPWRWPRGSGSCHFESPLPPFGWLNLCTLSRLRLPALVQVARERRRHLSARLATAETCHVGGS